MNSKTPRSRKNAPKKLALVAQITGMPANMPKVLQKNLQSLAGLTPLEVVANFAPEVGKNPHAMEKMAAMMCGIFPAIGEGLPDWVKSASAKFWDSLGLGFLRQNECDSLDTKKFGKLVGLIEQIQTTKPSLISEETHSNFNDGFTKPFVDFAKSEAAKDSPNEAADFFNGRAGAIPILEMFSGIPHRAKIYLVIALLWPEVEKFKSTNELHNWLLNLKNDKNKPIILGNTDSRETRKVCEIIGLNFGNKWHN